MAEPVLLATINTDDFRGLDDFDRHLQGFAPGELGQLDIPLDPEIAADEEFYDFLQSTNALNNELYGLGLTNWPGQSQIASLLWSRRIVRILFQATQVTPARYDYSPAVIWAIVLRGLLSRAGARMGTNTAFRNFANLRTVTTSAGHIRNLRVGQDAYKAGIRARIRGSWVKLPSLAFMAISGTLVFFALKRDTAMSLFKWGVVDPLLGAGKKALDELAEAAEAVAGKAGKPLLFAVGALVIGGGIWMMLKPKIG